jgi:hypothetical protein
MDHSIKNNVKLAIETYQCSDCVNGEDVSCFGKHSDGLGCGKHKPGTALFPNVDFIFFRYA